MNNEQIKAAARYFWVALGLNGCCLAVSTLLGCELPDSSEGFTSILKKLRNSWCCSNRPQSLGPLSRAKATDMARTCHQRLCAGTSSPSTAQPYSRHRLHSRDCPGLSVCGAQWTDTELSFHPVPSRNGKVRLSSRACGEKQDSGKSNTIPSLSWPPSSWHWALPVHGEQHCSSTSLPPGQRNFTPVVEGPW